MAGVKVMAVFRLIIRVRVKARVMEKLNKNQLILVSYVKMYVLNQVV